MRKIQRIGVSLSPLFGGCEVSLHQILVPKICYKCQQKTTLVWLVFLVVIVVRCVCVGVLAFLFGCLFVFQLFHFSVMQKKVQLKYYLDQIGLWLSL